MAESFRERRRRELAGGKSGKKDDGRSFRERRREQLRNAVDIAPSDTFMGTRSPLQPMSRQTDWSKLPDENRIQRTPPGNPDNAAMRSQAPLTPAGAIRDWQSQQPAVEQPMSGMDWVRQEQRKRRDRLPESGIGRVLGELAEPIPLGLDFLQAHIPGLSSFQRGAGEALNIETQTAPVNGSPIINAPARIAGNVAGVLTNPSNIGQGLVQAPYRVGQQIAQRFAPRANQYVQRGIEGATAGAIQGGVISGVRGETDAGELAKNIGLGAATGAIADPLVSLAGKGLSKAAQRIMSKYKTQQPNMQTPLGLPEPRQRGNINKANTPDVILNADTRPVGLPESSESLIKTRQNVTQARNELKVINDEMRKLNQQYERAIVDEFKHLKSSLNNRHGVTQGGVIRDETGEVIGRYGRQSNNPLWYQEFFAANGRQPTNKELYQLAKDRIDNGFKDEMGDIPGWKIQNAYDETVQSLESVRVQISSSLREMDTPLKVTDSPLISSELSFNRTQPNQDSQLGNLRSTVTPEREVEEILQAVQQPRVRDRVYSYLDEAEKAARERISRRGNRLSANPIDEWADHAVIMAAKLGKGTIKAADFAEELVKEFGEQIRPHANRIFRQTREVLRQQERRASKEGQEADAFNNSGRGNADSFDQKISRSANKRKVPFAQRWERIRTQFIDDLAPLEGVEKRVRGDLASAEDSLYKAARLFRGTPERANQIVRTRLAPVVQAVENAGYSADDLGRYALARHAQDVNAAGYKSGFTNAEIDDVLRRYGTPEMEQARQALVQINRDMMQELVDNGVVSRELADTLNERWQNYIPLFRSFDDDMVEFGGGLSNALANVASPIKGLKGSERAVIDPLENMVKNIFQSVNAAERNKVAGQLAKLADIDTEGQFIRRLDPDEKVGRKNVVNVKVNGENVKYEVEPEVYKAMLNLDQESSNMLINILSKPASILRAGATLTPEFSLRNPMRDVLQAFVTSQSGFNPITDFGAGLIQSISKGRLYQDWIDNLGAYGNIISQDRDVHRQALEKVLKQPVSKKFVNVINGRGLLNILRAISDTTESATKIGEYRAALRTGASPQEAAYRSRDVMDFARAGTSIRQTNRIVAFLNAAIQGKSKLIRATKANPVGTISRMFAAATLPTVGIYLLNNSQYASEEQRQIINDSPDWLKDTFWLVAIPGTDQVARIPKPFDIAPIFANLPEKALEYVRDNDPAAFDGFVRRSLADGALPYQISGLLPIVEGMANYSFFREGPIIPMREEGLEFRDQADPIRTTETARTLASGVERLTGGEGAFKNFSSPRIMDNTIRGLTAGLGSYATSAIDTVLKGTGLVDRPVSPEKRLAQRPLAKAFLVDSLQGGKSMDKFYEEREKLTKKRASARINEKPFEQEALYKYLNNVAKKMSDINKQVRIIEQSDLSAAEKRRQIEPLIQQRNQLARDAVKQGGLR